MESCIELILIFEFLPLLQLLLQKGHGGIDLDGYKVIPGRYYYIHMVPGDSATACTLELIGHLYITWPLVSQ